MDRNLAMHALFYSKYKASLTELLLPSRSKDIIVTLDKETMTFTTYDSNTIIKRDDVIIIGSMEHLNHVLYLGDNS